MSKQRRTTFTIAHRLSTIRGADTIAVVNAGKVHSMVHCMMHRMVHCIAVANAGKVHCMVHSMVHCMVHNIAVADAGKVRPGLPPRCVPSVATIRARACSRVCPGGRPSPLRWWSKARTKSF